MHMGKSVHGVACVNVNTVTMLTLPRTTSPRQSYEKNLAPTMSSDEEKQASVKTRNRYTTCEKEIERVYAGHPSLEAKHACSSVIFWFIIGFISYRNNFYSNSFCNSRIVAGAKYP